MTRKFRYYTEEGNMSCVSLRIPTVNFWICSHCQTSLQMPLFQKASPGATVPSFFQPQPCLISRQGQIKYANTQQVSPLLFIRKSLSSVKIQSSVNSQTNDCPCYWHSTPVIKREWVSLSLSVRRFLLQGAVLFVLNTWECVCVHLDVLK